MSIKIMTNVWDQSKAEGNELLVLLKLADHANDEGYCWPSVEALARAARASERTVQRALRSLEERGEIATAFSTGGQGIANMYRVNFTGTDDKGVKMTPQRKSRVTPVTKKGDTAGRPRVTPVTKKGDTSDTRIIKEPSSEPSGESSVSLSNSAAVGQKDRKGTRRVSASNDPGFDRWYAGYPRKVKRGRAEKAWEQISPSPELVDRMVETLERQKRSRDWTKDDGAFIPHPATWLNDRQWEDEVPEPEQTNEEWIASLAEEAEGEQLAEPDTIQDDDDVIEADVRPITPAHVEAYRRATEPVRYVDDDDDDVGLSVANGISAHTARTLDDLTERYRALKEEDEPVESWDDEDDDSTSPYVEGSTDDIFDDEGYRVIGGR